MAEVEELLEVLNNRLARIELILSEVQNIEPDKEWYSIAEVAELLGKANFTVREWARLGRVHAMKRACGRSSASEWMIAHKELQRIQNKGLLPLRS